MLNALDFASKSYSLFEYANVNDIDKSLKSVAYASINTTNISLT